MKKAIVYFSYDGSTRVAAEILAEKMNADIFELEEIKTRSHKPSAFMGAAFAALLGRKSRLKNTYAKEMTDYERIYIGTPIWANRCAPAVNTFVCKADLAGKDIVVFTLQADGAPERSKSAERLHKTIEKKGAVVADFIRLVGAHPGQTVARDEASRQIDAIVDESN